MTDPDARADRVSATATGNYGKVIPRNVSQPRLALLAEQNILAIGV